MDDRVYKEMAALEDSYWWFVGKRILISAFIGCKYGKVLDIGCGTGAMMKYLAGVSDDVVGMDDNDLAIFYARRYLKDCQIMQCDARHISIKDNTFDLVVASELLEHVNDDEVVLQEINRILKVGGKLIVTVPAFPFLWSRHDEITHHVRRYNIGLLKMKAAKINFVAEKISYTNFFAFLPVLLIRKLKNIFSSDRNTGSDFFYTPPFLNSFFIYFYRIESILLRKINFPFGVSVLGVFAKIK